jgi:hypothetical protein
MSSSLLSLVHRGLVHGKNLNNLESCAQKWYSWVCPTFSRTYLPAEAEGRFLLRTAEELRMLLDVYLLEKGLRNLGIEELKNQSHRVQRSEVSKNTR